MKKKIYVCPDCSRALNFSEDTEYTFYCVDCGVHFHECDVETEEQSRMEGIKDFTELAEVAMKIKEITDKAIQESDKQIKIKANDIVGQVSEYINEVIRPIIDSGIYKEHEFKSHVAIYNGRLRLEFPYGQTDDEHIAVFKLASSAHDIARNCVYFYANHTYKAYQLGEICLREIVENWHGFKDSMNRMIPYAIDCFNKENQEKIEKKQEMSDVLNSFRL